MNAEERLSSLYEAIASSGIRALVMGGHAVRFYGVERTTIDYDFHFVYPDWENLHEALRRILAPRGKTLVEAQSWRPRDFRRFVIGRLADGRDERLECWRANHLLAPFPELYERRTVGLYGRRQVAFLCLRDLIRSKETEREEDWRDIDLLEEIQDEHALAAATTLEGRIALLAGLRSRRGYVRAAEASFLADRSLVAEAWARARHPITRAFLSPHGAEKKERVERPAAPVIDEIVETRLPGVTPGSPRHLALVEAVRRLYKRDGMDADRKDKEGQASSHD